MPKPTNLGLWATNGGTTVEPLLAEKQAGWLYSKKLPAKWLNWWMNVGYQWFVWLDAYESTAHTWSELQTFTNGITVSGGAGDGAVMATGTGASQSGVNAQGGNGSGAFGARGLGGSSGTLGRGGLEGTGGAGTTAGGIGVTGIGGGTGAGAAGLAGPGGLFQGGDIAGGTNTTGAAGVGVSVEGGDITSDANNRKGGAALQATGGLGQAGRGPALKALQGGIELDNGPITQTALGGGLNSLKDSQIVGDLEVTDDLTVGDAASIAGVLTVGSITTEAPIAVTGGIGYQNGWGDGTGLGSSAAAYWKDKFGMVHMHGAIDGGTSGQVAFTLPTGYRPAGPRQFIVKDFGTSTTFYVTIESNGNVTPLAPSGGNTAPCLDQISFRAV